MEVQEIETQQPRFEKPEQKEQREQAADTKKSYQEKIAAELKEWATTVDRLKADIQRSGADVRRVFERHMERLRDRRQVVLRKLSALKRSREGEWETFKFGLEKSMDDLKQTLDDTVARFRKKQEEIAERVSNQRRSYVEKLEARFSDWSPKIDALGAKMEKAKTEAVMKYDKEIEGLRKKQLVAKEKLEEFKKSGNESWEDLKQGMDKAFAEMKQTFEKALSRMKKKK